MKKTFKIIGVVLLTLIGLLIVAFLVIRFIFRDEAVGALRNAEQTQRVETLRAAMPYVPDSVAFYFTYDYRPEEAAGVFEEFRLDTLLRKEATTWDNTLSLATFVAQQIPHGNHKAQPPTRDARGIWKFHCDSVQALNCRMHSILLHELLLAAGIANRYVTCFPEDPEDPDCHVVNIVWLPELQKWAMIDSDGGSYITDAQGTPLSLAEMRRSTIDGSAMEVRHLEGCTPYDNYLSYWAKNLYWFACVEHTGFGRETPPDESNTVYLVPENFAGFRLWEPSVLTSDETRFWVAPTIN